MNILQSQSLWRQKGTSVVGLDHPGRAEMEKFSNKVRKLGIPSGMALGPSKAEFEQLRLRQQLNENLNPRRKISA